MSKTWKISNSSFNVKFPVGSFTSSSISPFLIFAKKLSSASSSILQEFQSPPRLWNDGSINILTVSYFFFLIITHYLKFFYCYWSIIDSCFVFNSVFYLNHILQSHSHGVEKDLVSYKDILLPSDKMFEYFQLHAFYTISSKTRLKKLHELQLQGQ